MNTHALIPYDKDGFLSDRSHSCLDLTKGKQIKLHKHHNSKVTYRHRLKLLLKPCQGCNQKSRQSIEAGEGEVEGYCTIQRAWRLRVDGLSMLLGFWWMLVSVVMCHVSCVMCHVSCVICHVSCVMCHVSCVICRVS